MPRHATAVRKDRTSVEECEEELIAFVGTGLSAKVYWVNEFVNAFCEQKGSTVRRTFSKDTLYLAIGNLVEKGQFVDHGGEFFSTTTPNDTVGSECFSFQ